MLELTMPALSPTMEKGTLAKWLVAKGDRIEPGDVIAEIETDKATMELEADAGGWLNELLVEAGTEDVPVGQAIARLADAPVAGATDAPTASASPKSVPDMGAGETGQAQPAPDAAPAEQAEEPEPAAHSASATALASRYARAKGVPLPPAVRDRPVLLADLMPQPAAPAPTAALVPDPSPPSASLAPAPEASAETTDIPHTRERLNGMRRTIARRLTESKQRVPHIYLTVDVRLDALLALRAELNDALAARGVKLSINDFAIKAIAASLVDEPTCNVRFAGDALLKFARADIAVAVSLEGGLLTPVVKGAEARSLSDISTAMRDLAARARSGTLDPVEYAGGTASLSNLGMFGIDQFDAVINPPQATIVAVGSSRRRAWVTDDAIEPATIVRMTGSFDHRAIDGADAARFMKRIRELIEQPMDLMV